MTHQSTLTVFSGLNYLIHGIKLLIGDPELKRFVIAPIIINLIIFVVLSYFFVQFLGGVSKSLLAFLPDWLSFLAGILSVLLFLLFLLLYGYSFTLMTNLIAAPFYGMLSEKVEIKLTGKASTNQSLHRALPRTIRREITKLAYFIRYGILVFFGLLLLAFIPLINILAPLLGIAWSSWVMAIQYVDYPADNHQLSFQQLRQSLGDQKWRSVSLGGCILLGSMVPIVNIVVAPAAVVAGTIYWVEEMDSKKEIRH